MDIHKEKLYKSAVDAALAKNWDKAIELNIKVIHLDGSFIDSYLCIGYAYLQKGDLAHAKKYYRNALKFDPNNIIARNNIDKINILLKKGEFIENDCNDIHLDLDTFITIRGKTKNITLLNTGQPDVLATLKVGEKVFLVVKKRRIEVRNKKNEYIGVLPDDISRRLMFLMSAKCTYLTLIKSAGKTIVEVFIKEQKKGLKAKHFVSFPANVQDDLKYIAGKGLSDDKDSADSSDAKDSSDDQDEENVESIEDLEELAKADDERDTYYSDIPSHQDDFEE